MICAGRVLPLFSGKNLDLVLAVLYLIDVATRGTGGRVSYRLAWANPLCSGASRSDVSTVNKYVPSKHLCMPLC